MTVLHAQRHKKARERIAGYFQLRRSSIILAAFGRVPGRANSIASTLTVHTSQKVRANIVAIASLENLDHVRVDHADVAMAI